MQCYFHHLQNCFIDYFDDPILDDPVIYAGDVPFQYKEQESMYTVFLGNPTGNDFLATSRDHKLLLSPKGNASNISNNSIEPTKLNFVEYPINLMQITFPIPNDLLHPTYNA